MNVNNWGIFVWIGTGFDLIAYTALTMTFTKPDGTFLVVTNPAVSVPGIDEETTAGLFPANTYAQYITQPGDIDQVGQWSVRLTYQDADKLLTTDTPAFFTVDP